MSLSEETSRGVHVLMRGGYMQREEDSEENLRKQDTSKASFMSAGRAAHQDSHRVSGGCHAIAALSF